MRYASLVVSLALLVMMSWSAPVVLADDAMPADAASGFWFRGGAALGFAQSESLDQVNAILLDALNATAPPGLVWSSAQIEVDTMVGVSLGVGYRFHPRFALEGSFDWSRGDVVLNASFTDNGTPSSVSGAFGTFSSWSTTLDGRFFIVDGGQFEPYATVGLGGTGQTMEDSIGAGLGGSVDAFAARFGGGTDIHLSSWLTLNLDVGYLLGTGDLDGEDMVVLRIGTVGYF